MNKRGRVLIITVSLIILALQCKGGNIFTNGLYSSLVFYFCYIFISFDFMRRINKMSLYRFSSLKDMYIYVCKKLSVFIFSYTFLFMIIGVCSEMIGLLFGYPIFVSFEARIKFFALSLINLCILNFFQVVIRILYGKWISLVTICSCILISIGQIFVDYKAITPFVFNSAYLRGKTILTYHTLINYILCFIIIIFFTILSNKKDKVI